MNKKEEKSILNVIKNLLITCDNEGLKTEQKKVALNDFLFGNNSNNLGIRFLNPLYIEINEQQDINEEWIKINKFLEIYMRHYAMNNDVEYKKLKLEFINYGKTELVYVLTDTNGDKNTLLVKQPKVQFGKVKQEANNLIELKRIDKNIVAPIDYFENGEYELYMTPYLNQARCVASLNSWGMYVPEPYYRFEPFTEEQKRIVNICMIAKLVSLYNFEKKEGICSCKLGGGDFMLPKGWEDETLTIENTLNNLYLIAAREKIKCEFEDYLLVLKNEFSRTTIKEKQENLIVNLRGRVPMQISDIEFGIELGKKMIENKSVSKVKFMKRLKSRLI